MKHCSNENCKQVNPQDYTCFSSSKRAKDGLQSVCKMCQAEKTRKWYQQNKQYATLKRKERWQKSDKKKLSKQVAEWQRNNPDKIKSYHLKRKYGIDLTQYNKMLEKQSYVCKICRKPEIATDPKNNKLRDLAVDHCHETGKIRGLLCTNCNQGIGCFMDNIDLLTAAAKYLEEEGVN